MAIDSTKPTSALDSALRWIGDLDHPFYRDERQRFVWYEASAIGFQLIIILQFLLVGVLMLILGQSSFPYLAIGLGPTILTTVVVAGYAHARGAQYFASSSDLRRSRGVLGVGLIALYLAGLIRIGFDGGSFGESDGFDPSLIVGGVVGVAAVFVGMWLGKRKQSAADDAPDAD